MGIVNRIQNAWTRLQQFNPNTLVLVAADGFETTVNARGGEDYTIRLPMAGQIFGVFVALATIDQTLTTTPATIAIDDTRSDYGGVMSRVGGEFTVLKEASFTLLAELNLLQQQNNSITTVWIEVDGVPIDWSGTLADIGNAGVSDNPQIHLLYYPLFPGNVIRLRGVTTLSNGVKLDAIPAAPPAAGVAGARLSFTAVLRIPPV